jgi:type IV secretion system protein VirB2
MTTRSSHPISIRRAPLTLIVAVLTCISERAFAASAGMPWEGPITQLVSSLTGPVAKGIGIVAIVVSSLGFALAESGHAMKKFIGIVIFLSVAFTAGNFLLPFLGFSGGATL